MKIIHKDEVSEISGLGNKNVLTTPIQSFLGIEMNQAIGNQ